MVGPKRNPGAWIFVSHSNMDLEEVRRVRNALEEMGHNPLLFFLKCLNDDDELDDLIVREIKARDFFLLCDSENARRSDKVKDERAWIKTLKDKVYQEVDLQADWQSQLAAIKGLSVKATIFISYQRNDEWVVEQLEDRLREFDYQVISTASSMTPGENWQNAVEHLIDEALEHGYVLVVLTENSFRSKQVHDEMMYALSRHASGVVPLVIGDSGVVGNMMANDPDWNEMLQRHWLIVEPTPEGLDRAVTRLVEVLRSGP